MNEDKLLKQMVKRDPVRGAAATRRQVLQGIGAGAQRAAPQGRRP